VEHFQNGIPPLIMMMMDAQSMVQTLMEGAVAASVMRMTRAVRESLKEGYHPEEAKITRK
jgi:hypothetical protein